MEGVCVCWGGQEHIFQGRLDKVNVGHGGFHILCKISKQQDECVVAEVEARGTKERSCIKIGGDSPELGEATLVVSLHTLLHTGLHLRKTRRTTSGNRENRGDSGIRKCCPLITYTGTSRLFSIQSFRLVTVLVRFLFVCFFLGQGLIT